MTAEFSRNHFELLGLPAKYAVDPSRLEQGYRDLQSRVHPDRFAAATDADRRLAMQWATRANEAYRTLRAELAEARDEMLRMLGRALAESNYDAGCSLVRKLRFLEKLEEEIDDALEPLNGGAR